jgi:hypothetical protein
MRPKSLSLAAAFGLSITQSEADFVLPNLATDIPVCIDPFLLFKSRDASLRALHGQLLRVFARGFELHGQGDRPALDRLIDFPEVNAIGFGYSRGAIRGSGLGWHLNQLLADLLEVSDQVRARGLRHIEELQLLSVGVGPDRISDIAANILKSSLIEYTQQQAALWHIPVQTAVPVTHYFDEDDMEWSDGYFDLPVNPISGLPILLVPRRIVRLLPWINYDDFYSSEAQLLLPPRPRMPRYPGMREDARHELAKAELVARVRGNTSVLDQYVNRKESASSEAQAVLTDVDVGEVKSTGDLLIQRLEAIEPGARDATDFQRLVYEILNFLFEPELTGGELEVRTFLGTERRDIIYWNEAESSFWAYVRTEYQSPLLMFECKNVQALDSETLNQTATYLGARLGMLGFLVTRNQPTDAVRRKAYSIYNDSPTVPRKIILVLSDVDLRDMIVDRVEGRSPTPAVQRLYRLFRTSVQ